MFLCRWNDSINIEIYIFVFFPDFLHFMHDDFLNGEDLDLDVMKEGRFP